MLYTTLKLIHVLLAIVALGSNVTYAVWIQRAARVPEHLGFALRGVKILDDRLANPAYGLLLLSGLAMVFLGHLPLTAFWIVAAIALWIVAVAIAALGYTPTLRRQIRALDAAGAQSAEYRALDRRGTVIGVALFVVVLAILVLMVFKP